MSDETWDDAPCTDCGDTGITYQTERVCSCLAGLAIEMIDADACPSPTDRIASLEAQLLAAERERDALREALAKTAQPHFWWDVDDSENGCDDITSILDNYEIGEVIEVSCARNLPNQWAVGYVTESGGFRGQTFATEAEAVEFAAARAALTANHSAPQEQQP